MMHFRLLAIPLLVSLIFCGRAIGQTQYELNEDAKKAFEKADRALNAAYNKVMSGLDDQGKKELRESERLWIKFRDAECDSEANEYRGGSILPLIYFKCAKRLTEERTAQLIDRVGP